MIQRMFHYTYFLCLEYKYSNILVLRFYIVRVISLYYTDTQQAIVVQLNELYQEKEATDFGENPL